MTDLRQTIKNMFFEQLREEGIEICENENTNSMVLLESGLDSLGFAILVVRLESELGYDPFVLMEAPVYPRTLGEFIEIYETMEPESRA